MKKIRIKLGFNRDRLPISLIDLLIAGLMFYLAYSTKFHYIIMLGLLFALSAVLLIITKKDVNY